MAHTAAIGALASRMRALRQRRGWSAQRLADACTATGLASLTRSTIAKIESGIRKVISAEEAAALAEALGVPLPELVDSAEAKTQPQTNVFQIPGWPPRRPLTPWRDPSHREYYVDIGGSARTFDTFVHSMSMLTTFRSDGQTVLVTGSSGSGKSALANRCVDWTAQWLEQRGTRCAIVDLTTALLGISAPPTTADRMSIVCKRLFAELRLRQLIKEHALIYLESDQGDPHRFLPVLPLALVEDVAIAVLLPKVRSADEVTAYAGLVRGPVLLITESSSLSERDSARITHQLATPTPLIALHLNPLTIDDIRRFVDARLARSKDTERSEEIYKAIQRGSFHEGSIADLQRRLYALYETHMSLCSSQSAVPNYSTARKQLSHSLITAKIQARTRLGLELGKARRSAGITQDQAALALGCGQAKINRIESTTCAISAKDLNRLLLVYEADEKTRAHIERLAAECGPGVAAGVPVNRNDIAMLAYEREAVEILTLHAERIPNILQHERYTLKQYATARDMTDGATILVAKRDRESLFATERPPRYRALFSPSALYRMPGGRSTGLAIDQAQHLLTLSAKHPRLSIQVVPWEAELPYFPHDLTVLRFIDRNRDIAYIEYGVGESRIYNSMKQVAAQVDHWAMAHDAALSLEESQGFLHNFIDEARAW